MSSKPQKPRLAKCPEECLPWRRRNTIVSPQKREMIQMRKESALRGHCNRRKKRLNRQETRLALSALVLTSSERQSLRDEAEKKRFARVAKGDYSALNGECHGHYS